MGVLRRAAAVLTAAFLPAVLSCGPERGLDRNTIVVLTSDHGESFAEPATTPGASATASSTGRSCACRGSCAFPAASAAGACRTGSRASTSCRRWGRPWTFRYPRGSRVAACSPPRSARRPTRIGADGRRPRGDTPEERARGSEYSIRDARHRLLYYENEDRWELYDLREDPLQRESLHGRGLPEEARLRAALQERIERSRALAPGRRARPATIDSRDEARLRALGYLD